MEAAEVQVEALSTYEFHIRELSPRDCFCQVQARLRPSLPGQFRLVPIRD